MSDAPVEWTLKQYAMELHARGIAVSPTQAVAMAMELEREYWPHHERRRAIERAFHDITSGKHPEVGPIGSKPTPAQLDQLRAIARKAGDEARRVAEEMNS